MPKDEDVISGGNSKKLHVLQRQVHAATHSIRNHLLSIDRDASIVSTLAEIYPHLPLIANLRNGLWYAPKWHSTCYFKSTDGHNKTWAFSTSRLNLDVVRSACAHLGSIIVDSTRRGKNFPDSFSATVPIWCQVINCIVLGECPDAAVLPPWVPRSQGSQIRARIRDIVTTMSAEVKELIYSSLIGVLQLPLRPIWALHDADGSIEWLGDLAEDFVCNCNDVSPLVFTPLVLFSCSSDISEAVQAESHSWFYVKGAGDDEENWSRGLTPELFWRHRDALLGVEDSLLFEQEVDRIVASSLARSIAHAGDATSYGASSSSCCGGGAYSTALYGSSHIVAISDTGIHVALAFSGPIEEVAKEYDGVILLGQHSDVSISSLDSGGGEQVYCHITIPDDVAKAHNSSNRWIDAVITSSLRYYAGIVKDTSTPSHVLIASRADKAVAITVALAILTAFFGNKTKLDFNDRMDESQSSASNWAFERQVSRDITKLAIKLKLLFIQGCFSSLVLPRYVAKDINTFFLSPSKAHPGQNVVYGESLTLWDSIGV
jgi:hypothetical protein